MSGISDRLAERIAEATAGQAPVSLADGGADRALLEELRKADTFESAESVSFGDWLSMVQEELLSGFGRRVGTVVPWEPLLKALFWGLAVVVAAVLLSTVVLGIRQLWLRRGAAEAETRVRVETTPAPPAGRDLRRELQALLEGADPEAALRALWTWVAVGLHEAGRARWSPDITHRELVASTPRGWTGRTSLRDLGRTVERLVFSGEPVEMGRVSELLPEAEQVLALAEAQ